MDQFSLRQKFRFGIVTAAVDADSELFGDEQTLATPSGNDEE